MTAAGIELCILITVLVILHMIDHSGR